MSTTGLDIFELDFTTIPPLQPEDRADELPDPLPQSAAPISPAPENAASVSSVVKPWELATMTGDSVPQPIPVVPEAIAEPLDGEDDFVPAMSRPHPRLKPDHPRSDLEGAPDYAPMFKRKQGRANPFAGERLINRLGTHSTFLNRIIMNLNDAMEDAVEYAATLAQLDIAEGWNPHADARRTRGKRALNAAYVRKYRERKRLQERGIRGNTGNAELDALYQQVLHEIENQFAAEKIARARVEDAEERYLAKLHSIGASL